VTAGRFERKLRIPTPPIEWRLWIECADPGMRIRL
jgi:hypothetical protein